MSLIKKQNSLAQLSNIFSDSSKSIFLLKFDSINANSIAQLRKSLISFNNTSLFVAKNTLTKIAVSNTSYSSLSVFCKGNIMICSTSDDIFKLYNHIKFLNIFNLDFSLISLFSSTILLNSEIKFLSKFASFDNLRLYFLNLLLSGPYKFLFSLSKNPILLDLSNE